MANLTETKNVPQAEHKKKFSVAISTDAYRKLINNTLSDAKRSQNFIAAISSAVATNPALQDCDAGTILAGALLGESLKLAHSPQLGRYYLVPFGAKNSDTKKAQFILGYKGYLELALRSGQYKDIDVMEIKEGEYKGKNSRTGKPEFEFIEDDDVRDSLPTIGYMAYYEYLNGFVKTLYWSREKMLNHADQFSSAFDRKAYEDLQAGKIADKDLWKYSSFWYKDFDSMAKKTMLRQLISKWGVMSAEMVMGFETDSKIGSFNNKNELVSDYPEDIVEQPEVNDVVVQALLEDF